MVLKAEVNSENQRGRTALVDWEKDIHQNIYQIDEDFKHTVSFYLAGIHPNIDSELIAFADVVINLLDDLVIENNQPLNLPKIENYDAVGNHIEKIVHHPSYAAAGNIIYQSRILERMSRSGGLTEALTFMFLSSQVGEAGHNCPMACSAGIIRVLQKTSDFPNKSHYLQKLITPFYSENFTGAQFLTEVQGGSDVGQNATKATQDDEGNWHIEGEKWFCSNADAELILVTARFDPNIKGTKGLGLFLVPSRLESGEPNYYTMRRLKDKIGTRSLATAEIDFKGSYAIAMGSPSDGFKMVMENVLHISRLFNTFCVLGMSRRAYYIALAYARHREAFGQAIINYPLVKENLAIIKVENTALIASIYAVTQLQDAEDLGSLSGDDTKLLLRLLANLNKYISALWSVEHIHHALDILAGNGAIESFSIIPRLLRDCIVCENWEGTHNVLRMQILKDILRYHIDDLFLRHVERIVDSISDPIAEKYKSDFNKVIERLKKELKILKEAPPELQSLKIKDIVDQMAILFAGVQLGVEAFDQAKKGSQSKLRCLEYYRVLHFQERSPIHDQAYLDLIKAVIP